MDNLVSLLILALIGYGVYRLITNFKSNTAASKEEQNLEFTGVTKFGVGEPVLVAQGCPFLGNAIDGLQTKVLAVGMRGTVVAVHRTPVEFGVSSWFSKPKSSGYDIVFGHEKVRIVFGAEHLLVRPVV
jgi:hypothetical protein